MGKTPNNSTPVWDSGSRCTVPAINIKPGFGMGFGMGFQLAPLPDLIHLQAGGVGCRMLLSSPLLSLSIFSLLIHISSPSINHSNGKLGKKEFSKSLFISRNVSEPEPALPRSACGGGKALDFGIWGMKDPTLPRVCREVTFQGHRVLGLFLWGL